jgi:hypothetical protein
MRVPYLSIATGAAMLLVLASAASLAVDTKRGLRDGGVERTVALADLCGEGGCSIAYKTDDGGPPSRVVQAR